MVGRFDDVQVVLDDDDRVALVDELVEHVQQFPRVLEMESRRRLVEDVERSARAAPRQLARQLHPLGFPARECGRGLPQLDVPQPHVLQRPQLVGNRRERLEQRQRLIDGQVEDLRDRLPAVLDVEGLPVVAEPLAVLAGDVDVGEEVHLDRDDAVPLAGLAASPFHVEREATGPEAARLRVGHHRKQIPDEGEKARVGRWVRSGRPADGRLIDLDHLVERGDAVNLVVSARFVRRPVQRSRKRSVQDVVHQGGLARPADAGDRCEQADRNPDVDVLQVVRAGASDDDLALERGAPDARRRDGAQACEVRPRNRTFVPHQVFGGALEDDVAAMLACARPEVDDVVGRPDGLLVVLDDNDGVPQITKARERGEQLAVVALVQSD